MFASLITIFAIFTGASLLLALFLAIYGEIKIPIVLLVVGILCIVAMVSLSQISKSDLENNFNNQLRHSTIITQVKSVSEDDIILSNGAQYLTRKMVDKLAIKEINVGDVVEVVYFESKMDTNYVYSIKKLKVTYGKWGKYEIHSSIQRYGKT